jgi:hypothetical protein
MAADEDNDVKYLVLWASTNRKFTVAHVQWFDRNDYPEENMYAMYKDETTADIVALLLNNLVDGNSHSAQTLLQLDKLTNKNGTDW